MELSVSMENRRITVYLKSVKTEKVVKVGVPLDVADFDARARKSTRVSWRNM